MIRSDGAARVASLADRRLDRRSIPHPGGQADQVRARCRLPRGPDPRQGLDERRGRPRELPALKSFLHPGQDPSDRIRSVRGRQQAGQRPVVAVGTVRRQGPCHALEHCDAEQGGVGQVRRTQQGDHRVAILSQLSLECPPDLVWDIGILKILVMPDQSVQDRQCVVGLPSLATRRELASDHRVGLRGRQGLELRSEIPVHPMIVAQQPEGPAPHARDWMLQELHRRRVVEPAADMQRPEIAESHGLVAVRGQHPLQQGHDGRIPALGEDVAGPPPGTSRWCWSARRRVRWRSVSPG